MRGRQPPLNRRSRFALFVLVVLGTVATCSSPSHLVTAAACPISPLAAPLAAPGAPPLYLGLDAYTHLDKLSYLEIGDRVASATTADPGGTNEDNIHYVRGLPDGGRVLLDLSGPGVLTFARMQEDYGGPWRLGVDAEPELPVATGDLGQQVPASAAAAAFPYPFSLNPSESQGSSSIAAPIPFQQHIQLASAGSNGNFYALYRKLPYGTRLAAWGACVPPASVIQLLNRAGSDIAPEGLASQRGTLTLSGNGAIMPVTTLTGPAQIRALTLRVPYAEMVHLGNARLLISWDGDTRPSVDVPVKFLVGDGAGVYQPAHRPLVRGWPANTSGDGSSYMQFNLYWPMPFHRSARIALASASALANVAWEVRYEPFPDPPSWWGTFHATYTSIPSPPPGQDMTFLDVTGSGRLVGTIINFTRPDATLEGDPHFYIDDSQTPQIEATGTEEWGLGGDYWHGGVQTSLPLGGLPSSVNNSPGADVDGAALYRFLIADSVPFNRHLVVRWEHGGVDNVAHAYRAVMLWYGTPAQTAVLSDALLPGDASSRAAHHYEVVSGRSYQLSAGYEYTVHAPLLTQSGVAMSGASSFTLALDPHNAGAFLRRTLDACVPDQRANVYVDGQFAGTWYSAGVSSRMDMDGHRRCWRDEEFPLAAALTVGKSAITVRIEVLPTTEQRASVWTEFGYQLYSYVLPAI